MAKDFDVVVYGATGYTGRLVAEYLSQQYGADGDIRWAMAGRSADKLAAVRDEIGAPADTPLVTADASDTASLAAMVQNTKSVATTVGPYQLYGAELVAACAAEGTDYVDLCGETPFMRKMIDAHEDAAKESGARITFSCGFDSIPFDLGVYYLQDRAIEKLGAAVPRVKGRVRKMQGTFSGGTAASMRATMEAAADPDVLQLLMDPFSLTPGFKGAEQPAGDTPEYDESLGSWAAPFIMAAINTRNIHRSNFLLGHAYGKDFQYDEMMLTGPGKEGEEAAKFVASNPGLGGENDPKPGEGPSKEERDAGFYDILFAGAAADGGTVKVAVTGDKDPGYGSTSKMLAESAICLVKDCEDVAGGVYTPAPAMGGALIKRLVANAGLTFEVEE